MITHRVKNAMINSGQLSQKLDYIDIEEFRKRYFFDVI